MNAAYLRLLWKEYRAARAFWLSLFVLSLVLQGLALQFAADLDHSFVRLAFLFGLAAPAFFAVGAAGTAFAVEREEGTYDFLRAAPVSPSVVLAAKWSCTVIATLLLLLVLWPLSFWLAGNYLPRTGLGREALLGLWLLAAIEAIAWGTLFSLRSARPLVAVVLALVVTFTIPPLLDSIAFRPSASVATYVLPVIPLRLLIVTVLLAVDVMMARRWLADPVSKPPRKKLFALWTLAATDTQVAAKSESTLAPDRFAAAGRLLWQHARQSSRLMAIMAVVQVALVVITLKSGIDVEQELAILTLFPLVGMVALAGSSVFLPDQERERFRFFIEHNVPPRLVWLTRIVPWMLVLTASTLVAYVIWTMLARPTYGRHNYGYQSAVAMLTRFGMPALVCAVVAFAAGQWSSMMIRRGLLAGLFGLVFAGILCGWTVVMWTLQVNPLLAIVPIPLVLLGATWLRAPDWIADNHSTPARVKAAAALVLPACALSIALPINRVSFLPKVGPGFDVARYGASEVGPLDHHSLTALYQRADSIYVFPSVWNNRLPGTDSREIDALRSQWLDANAETISLLLKASGISDSILDDPSTGGEYVKLSRGRELIALLIFDGRREESEGRLDAALDRYFAALRIISHWSAHSGSRWEQFSGNFTLADLATHVLAELPYWAVRPGQSVERIRGAIDRLGELDPDFLHLEDALKASYVLADRFIRGDREASNSLYFNSNHPRRELIYFLRKVMPWEKDRALRLLNVQSQEALDRLRLTHTQLAKAYNTFSYRYPYVYHIPANDRAISPTVAGMGQWGARASDELLLFEDWRRATMIVLALVSYRIEHGELPQSLDALAGSYFPAVPLDAYVGASFRYFPHAATDADLARYEALEAETGEQPLLLGEPCLWGVSPRLRARNLNEPIVQLWSDGFAFPIPAQAATPAE